MRKQDFYYDLPEKLIAQHPSENREESRLMTLDKKTGKIFLMNTGYNRDIDAHQDVIRVDSFKEFENNLKEIEI